MSCRDIIVTAGNNSEFYCSSWVQFTVKSLATPDIPSWVPCVVVSKGRLYILKNWSSVAAQTRQEGNIIDLQMLF